MSGFLDRGYYSGHGGRVVKNSERKIYIYFFTYPVRHACNSQRLAAEIEEIVCEHNCIDTQDIPPDIRYHSGCPPQHPRAGCILTAANCPLKFLCINFAVSCLRHPVDPDEDCWRRTC